MKIIPIENITDGLTTSKPKDIFHVKGLTVTNLSCPMCHKPIYYNVNTRRYRCRFCGMLFSSQIIQKIKAKQELREHWLRLQME